LQLVKTYGIFKNCFKNYMDSQTTQLYQTAFQRIEQADKILLVTHYNPDGDGLSCVCAMAEYLKLIHKDYFIYCYNQPAATFEFLPNIEQFNYHHEASELPEVPNFNNFDLILVFDCGSLSRTRLEVEIKTRTPNQFVIEFDHHPKIEDYADLEIRDHQAAATTELVYHFFKTNRLKMNRNIANCLLTGILTDTANFLYPSTSESTIKISSEMLSLGAKLPQITESTLRTKSLEAMKLWGKIMSNLQINPKYNLAITVLTQSDLNGGSINSEELEGLSNFLGNLYGVKAIMLLREEADGKIRGSLRTADQATDLTRLAHLLGGGGHAKAAGFTIEGKLIKSENSWRVE
jgi:phosphoesterase RecJ-like protein